MCGWENLFATARFKREWKIAKKRGNDMVDQARPKPQTKHMTVDAKQQK